VISAPDAGPGLGEPIGVAVVGAGYWGPNLVRNFAACPGFRLRWLCDLDPRRAEKVLGPYSTVGATGDLDAVLADDQVHAVAVATPATTHADVAGAALRAGKHVLVEKPLAPTYTEGQELVALAESRQLQLMCDHTYCYTPAVMKIREVLCAGELGDLHFFDSVRINLGLVQQDVDVLWDLAPHDLSILDSILPPGIEPLAVTAHGADPIGAGRSCVAFVTLELTGGAIAHLHVNWLSPTKVRSTLIGGSKRALLWDDLNPVQRVSVFDRGVDLVAPEDLPEQARRDAIISYRTGDVVSPALPEREALHAVVEEFATCIRTGRAPITDGRAGLRVLDILEAASRSMRFHGAVVGLRATR
jgi:predicted dehydrogenase